MGPSGPRTIKVRPDSYNPNYFEKFAQGYADQDKQYREADALREIYQQYQDQGMGLEQKFQLLQQDPRISPSRRAEVAGQLKAEAEINAKNQLEMKKTYEENLKRQKESAEKERIQNSVKELYGDLVNQGLMSKEEAQRRSLYDSEATARSVYSQKAKSTTNEYEKLKSKKQAEEAIKLEGDIPKAKDALSNLDYIEKVYNKDLTGPFSYVKAAVGSQSASEVDTLGFTSIEPIIKLFNPVGPIPVQKLKIIQNEFQPKATDNRWKFKGKIESLRRIGNQALARAQERLNLINQYQGNPPQEIISEFDKESENFRDVLLDQELYNTKTKDMKADDLVEGLVSKSNGKKLKGIPKKEADKLMQQGLVTYE